jgi:hypothetical protein
MNNLLLAGTPVIEIPKKMISITKKGKFVEIPTLTKTKAITTRDKKKVIKFESTDNNYINIKDEGLTKKSRINNIFSDIKRKYDMAWREYSNLLPEQIFLEKEIHKIKSLKRLTKDKQEKLYNLEQEYIRLIERFNEIEKKKELYRKKLHDD